jgi:hypothetical protein
MSRGKGNRAAAWLAAYLRPWFPSAEATPNGRPGRDVLGTPGIAIELKTGAEWRATWLKQAAKYASEGELPWLVYMPPGCGERQIGRAMVIVPLEVALPWAVAAGYAPERADPEGGE